MLTKKLWKKWRKISREANSNELMSAVIKTSLQGKIDSLLAEHLTGFALTAAKTLANEEGGTT